MGIKAWITIRGNHIPIMDGESKASAIGRFINTKRQQEKIKRQKQHDMEKEHIMQLEPERFNRAYAAFRDKMKEEQATRKTLRRPQSKAAENSKEDAYKIWRQKDTELAKQQHDLYDEYARSMGSSDAMEKAAQEFLPKREALKNEYRAGKFNTSKNNKLDKIYGKYKLKTDKETPKRTIRRMETAKEIVKRAQNRIENAKENALDGNYKNITQYNKLLKSNLAQARKENDTDLPKLERAVKYQGYISAKGENKMKRYKSSAVAQRLSGRRAIDEVMTNVYGKDWEKLARKKKK